MLGTRLLSGEDEVDVEGLGTKLEHYILQDPALLSVMSKTRRLPRLRDVAEEVATGISSGLDSAYVHRCSDVKLLQLEGAILKKLAVGGEVDRYSLEPKSGKMIMYLTTKLNIADYPHAKKALIPYRDRLMLRRECKNGKIPWYALNWPRRAKLFDEPKIVIRQTSEYIRAAYDDEQWYFLKSAILVQLPEDADISILYLLGILNSKLIRYVYHEMVDEEDRVFPEVKPVQIFQLPIAVPDFAKKKEAIRHDRIATLVKSMIESVKKLEASHDGNERAILRRTVHRVDKEIDKEIYKAYGLEPEEIEHLDTLWVKATGE